MTSEHSSLEKYNSHSIRNGCERVMCERWVGDWTKPQHIDLQLFLVLLGCSTRESWGPSLCWIRVLTPWTATTASKLWTPTDLNFLSHWVISSFDAHLLLVGIISALNSTRPQSRLSPDIFDWMHLLFTQVHFLFDSLAGLEVNMLVKYFRYINTTAQREPPDTKIRWVSLSCLPGLRAPPPREYLLGRAEFISWCLRHPKREMPTGQRIFCNSHARVLIYVWLPFIRQLCVKSWLGRKSFNYSLITGAYLTSFSGSHLPGGCY